MMMKCHLLRALRLCLAVLVVVAVPVSGRAAGGAHLVIHAIPVGIAPDALVLDAPAHRLFVANTGPPVAYTAGSGSREVAVAYRTSPGSVSVIDTQTDRVVASIPIDVWPQDLALDTRRHRLYVFCADALPVHISPTAGWPVDMKPTLDVVDTRTLRVITRKRLPVAAPLDISVPFYPAHLLTLDPASNHLLVQAFDRRDPPTTAAFLYDASSLRVLRTYPAPLHPHTDTYFAAQTATTPLFIYARFQPSAKPLPPISTTSTKLAAQPAVVHLASGVATALRQLVLFDPWSGPLPYYGEGLSAEIRDMYATSTVSRLLVLTAYSGDYQPVAGPPYTLGIYDLQHGTPLRQLVFASGAPRGQQAVAFDEDLGYYYALGTAPNPKHPTVCAPVNNIVIGDLQTGKVVHTAPGRGLLTVVLVDAARHLVYAATGNGGTDPVCTPAFTGPPKPGLLQVIDGRTGATLTTAPLPGYTVTASGLPSYEAAGQASALALDPSTGTVYAVDGRGGNAVYVISLAQS